MLAVKRSLSKHVNQVRAADVDDMDFVGHLKELSLQPSADPGFVNVPSVGGDLTCGHASHSIIDVDGQHLYHAVDERSAAELVECLGIGQGVGN